MALRGPWSLGCHSEELALLPLCIVDIGESLRAGLRLCLLRVWHTPGQLSKDCHLSEGVPFRYLRQHNGVARPAPWRSPWKGFVGRRRYKAGQALVLRALPVGLQHGAGKAGPALWPFFHRKPWARAPASSCLEKALRLVLARTWAGGQTRGRAVKQLETA